MWDSMEFLGKTGERPPGITVFSIILILNSIYLCINTIDNVFLRGNFPLLPWPLTVGMLSAGLLSSGLFLMAGIGAWQQKRWAWWLTGVCFVGWVVFSPITIFALFTNSINGELLYQLRPFLLFTTVARALIACTVLFYLYTVKVKEYFQMDAVHTVKSLVSLLGYALLFGAVRTALLVILPQLFLD